MRPTNNEELLKKYFEKECEDFTKLLEKSDGLERTITIGAIDEDTGVVVDELIRFWNRYDDEREIPVEEREPIKMYIDSPGGYLSSVFTSVDAISLSKTPVWTINVGCAYSGGFFIFLAGHRRITYPHSSFLYHEGSTSTGGNADRFDNFTDFYKKQRELLKNITLKYTKVTEEEYNQHKNEDWWILSNEAIEKGIADEIATTLI